MSDPGQTRERHAPPQAADARGALQTYLLPGEQILWTGEPDPAFEMVGPYLGCFGLGLTGLGVAIGAIFALSISQGWLPIETRLGLSLMAVVPLGLLVGGVLLLREPGRLREKTRHSLHAVTSQRLLTLVRRRKADELTFVAARAIGPVHLARIDDRRGTITIETHSSRASDSTTRLTQTLNWFGVSGAEAAYRLIAELQRGVEEP